MLVGELVFVAEIVGDGHQVAHIHIAIRLLEKAESQLLYVSVHTLNNARKT